MGYARLKEKAHALFEEAPFINQIHNQVEYQQALDLMDELIEDYDYNRPLIDTLSISIDHFENESEDFRDFNIRIKSLDTGVAVLKTLMSQYNLGVNDFPEIGSKSLVSKIINNERRLTLDHIRALMKRFKLNPSVFFNKEVFGNTEAKRCARGNHLS